MIGRITGTLLQKSPPQITLDVGGLGYEIDVPMSTFYNLPEAGARVTLHTHLVVREDVHLLFGFLTEDERATFRQLIKITGIGARMALAVLSGLSVAELAQAIARQEPARLTKVPGIGKKTAERLLLELRDKLPKATSTPAPAAASDDILNALIALGYNEKEVATALKQLPAEISVSDGIRLALKHLSKV